MALQIRRGTDAERLSITPEAGEPVFTLDTKEFFIGDGITQGGVLVSGTLVNEGTPALGADLDLNGNNIVGTGNINITGTVTASGNINLGDGAEDNVIVGGQIASSLIPGTGSTYDLGTSTDAWANLYADNITTNVISASSISGTLDGDVNGSVYRDDSTTVLVDAINGTLGGNLLGNVRKSDNSEDILNTTNKTLNIQSITFDTTGPQGAIITTPGDLTMFTKTTFLTLDTPDSANPFIKVTGFHDGVDANAIVGSRARGTLATPLALQDGDEIFNFSMSPFNGTTFPDGGSLIGVSNYDGANYSTKWVMNCLATDGSLKVGLEVNDSGIKTNSIGTYDTESVDFTAAPKLPVYADATARDAAITTPAAGMVVLTGTEFQGYDGSAWVALS